MKRKSTLLLSGYLLIAPGNAPGESAILMTPENAAAVLRAVPQGEGHLDELSKTRLVERKILTPENSTDGMVELGGCRLQWRYNVDAQELHNSLRPALILKGDGKLSPFDTVTTGTITAQSFPAAILVLPPAEAPHLPGPGYLQMSQSEIMLGLKEVSQQVNVPIYLRNPGNTPVEIAKVKTSCGRCTVAEVDPQVIPPGGSGVLRTSISMPEASGQNLYSLSIDTSSERVPHLIANMHVKVVQPVDFQPEIIHISGNSPSASLTVTSLHDLDLHVVDSGPTALQVLEVGPIVFEWDEELPELNTYRVPISAAAHADPGTHALTLTLSTGRSIRPQIKIPIFLEVPTPVRTEPEYLLFGSVPQGAKKDLLVKLVAPEGGARIISWASSSEAVRVLPNETSFDSFRVQADCADLPGEYMEEGKLDITFEGGPEMKMRLPFQLQCSHPASANK